MLADNIREILNFDKDLSVLVSVGNTLRSDDGVGPYIASRLKSTRNLKIIDAKTRPDNIIDEVCEFKPKKIVIIDAANFNGAAGEARIIPEDLIPHTTVSTHSIPLRVISRILKEDTSSDIYFIGIQMKVHAFGENLSEEVKDTADEIIKFITGGRYA